jgi:HNH endonuclease
VSIPDADLKILWGRAGGICSNPGCNDDLTIILAGDKSFNIGEMAHIIARQPNGPRGVAGGGDDRYENLILLCPTCHTKIDKAPPGMYKIETLISWKNEQEDRVRSAGKREKFSTLSELKIAVSRILLENEAIFMTLGPRSLTAQADVETNQYDYWVFKKLSKMIPNNRRLVNMIEANNALLTRDLYSEFIKFKVHVEAFERNQYIRMDSYPLFPQSFKIGFSDG